MNLTVEEARALRDELSMHCVSYYSATLRDAMDKAIQHCDKIIEEYEEIQFDSDSLSNKSEGEIIS